MSFYAPHKRLLRQFCVFSISPTNYTPPTGQRSRIHTLYCSSSCSSSRFCSAGMRSLRHRRSGGKQDGIKNISIANGSAEDSSSTSSSLRHKKRFFLLSLSSLPRIILLGAFLLVTINTLVYFSYHAAAGSSNSLLVSPPHSDNRSLPVISVVPDNAAAGVKHALEDDFTCVMTISAWNNFGFVWNLYDSIVENSPTIGCFVWFVGDNSVHPDEKYMDEIKRIKDISSKFSVVTMIDMQEELGEENFHWAELAFKFNMVELQTTLKPFAFQYMFQKIRAKASIFLDNDIWVTSTLLPLQLELQRRSAIVTPHIVSPIPEDGKKQKDLDMLLSGVFNFGFVAFSNTPQSAKFLQFWGQRLTIYGYHNPSNGMFFDQNWGMFIPAFFDHEDYLVIRDKRYNVAYWNLHDTGSKIHLDEKTGLPHLEDDQPTVFVHFSGMSLLEEYDMHGISRHQTRYTLEDFPRLKQVLEAYIDRLQMHNALAFRAIPYGYKYFSDGTTIISDEMRRAYAAIKFPDSELVKDGLIEEEDKTPFYGYSVSTYDRVAYAKHVTDNPFCADTLLCERYGTYKSNSATAVRTTQHQTGEDVKMTFLEWYTRYIPGSSVNMEGLFFFTGLEHGIWMKRKDIQEHYPDPSGANFAEFKKWFMKNSVKEKLVDKNIYLKWHAMLKDQVTHHSKYHKKVQKAEDIGVNIIGWHGGKFSIGIIANKLYAAAHSAGLNVNAIQLPSPGGGKKFSHPSLLNYEVTRSPSEFVNVVAVNADCTPFVTNNIPSVVRSNKYNIGYWAWELDVFPKDWIHYLKKFDEIWCLSVFIKNSLETTPGYDGTPVRVLNLPLLDEEAVQPMESAESLPYELMPLKSQNTNPFVFLVVFDFMSYPKRKNPSAVIKAFLDAFPKEKDPTQKFYLVVKAHSGTADEMEELKAEANNDPRIIFIFRVLNDAENIALHNYQDCYVSLHRSEGYGLNILESMGAGIPVIATSYSGNADFFGVAPSYHPQCHYLVPFKIVELKEDYGPYKAGNHWAEPDHDYTVKAMRKVVKQNCKQAHGKTISRLVFNQFGQNAIGKKMQELLAESLPLILRKQEVQISNNEAHIENTLTKILNGNFKKRKKRLY